MAEKRQVRFIRRRGRIIPIRSKKKEGPNKAISAGALIAGTAVTDRALRTKTIYHDPKTGTRIDKRVRARTRLGIKNNATELTLFKNNKNIGYVNIGKESKEVSNINFLKVDKKQRGKGFSKVLTQEAAREMKRQGAKSTMNQVIHKGSLLSNFDKKRDLITDEFGKKISMKAAKNEIELFQILDKGSKKPKFKGSYKRLKMGLPESGKRSVKNLTGSIAHSLFPDLITAKDSGVFRETSLKYLRKKGKFSTNPFRTRRNKLSIFLGSAAMIAGVVGLSRKSKER